MTWSAPGLFCRCQYSHWMRQQLWSTACLSVEARANVYSEMFLRYALHVPVTLNDQQICSQRVQLCMHVNVNVTK